jgi:uncharacterized protein
MRIINSIFMILLFSARLVAEDSQKIPLIAVTGTYEMNIAPDEIKITVKIENREEGLAAAKNKTDTQAKKLIALAKANQIQNNDIVTSYVDLAPRRDTRKADGRKIIYFLATQKVIITLRDFSKYDAFMETLVKDGLGDVLVEYGVSDLPSYRRKARVNAILAAQEKAKLLAEAIGQKIGKAYSITEVVQNTPIGANILSNYISARSVEARDSDINDSALSVGNIVVKVTVEVSFILE